MRVSLASSATFGPVKKPGTQITGQPVLETTGPHIVIGWSKDDFAKPIQPTASDLFGPRGVCLHKNGSLWIADTGHHRLLGWSKTPRKDNEPADFVIGQPSFFDEGRNAKSTPSAQSLNVPTGICAFGKGLAVADAWNHRVLIWHEAPNSSHQSADIVLGQQDFSSILANHGSDTPTAGTLHWPYGIAEIDGKLVVCDTGNRRILIWNNVTHTGQAADLVLGQNDFLTRDENAGDKVSMMSMRWPHQICLWQKHLAIADAGNNRVMLWKGIPKTNGAPCDALIGQLNFENSDHNLGEYYPTNKAVNMPYALACHGDQLLVGDTANSRILGWQKVQTGAAATGLTGQVDFSAKGDNRWGIVERDSLCWPYGLSVRGDTVAIADSGNNRILLWDIAQ